MLSLLLIVLSAFHASFGLISDEVGYFHTHISCDARVASCPDRIDFSLEPVGVFIKKFLIRPPDIVATGDLMLSRSVGANLKKYGSGYITNTYNPFADVASGSILIANLESPFSFVDKDVNEASFLFAANPANIAVLEWLAVGHTFVVSLANNHIANAGYQGFATTIETLDAAHILHTGLSRDERVGYISITKNHRKYCIGGYSYDGNVYHDRASGVTWYVSSLDDAIIDIEKMNAENCDERIFLLHWGSEYRTNPLKTQTDLAHTLIDHGATLIIGAHSHILGKAEQYAGKWIFYSLGNAIFDQEWGRNGCQSGMDCITDNFLQKNTVPTYIGTAVYLPAPYNRYNQWQWDIRVGKMTKRE